VHDLRSFQQKLEGAERGLELIQRTRVRDDRRVMLGYLFNDLDALRKEISTAPPELRARYALLATKALELLTRDGAPIKPDEDPGKAIRRHRRRKKEDRGATPKPGNINSIRQRYSVPHRSHGSSLSSSPQVPYLRREHQGHDLPPDIKSKRLRSGSRSGSPASGSAEVIHRRKKKKARKASKPQEPYAKFLLRNPEARYWLDLGLKPRPARALCDAGVFNLEQLSMLSREDFVSIPGTSEITLAICERALGRPLKSWRQYWIDRGLGGLATGVLLRARIQSVAQLKAMAREEVLALSGMGSLLLESIEQALGFHLTPTPLGYWMEQGFYRATANRLVRAGILTLKQLAKRRAELHKLGLNALELHMVEVVLQKRET